MVKMTARRGGIFSVLLIIVILIMLVAAAVLAAGAVGRRSALSGAAMLEEGDYARAAELLERAKKLSLRPDMDVLMNLACARLKLGETEAAKELFARAASLAPQNAAARYELGKIYAEENDTDTLRGIINELDGIGTDEARKYAAELRARAAGAQIKGLMNGLMDKILPHGIPDALKNVIPDMNDDTEE